VAPPDLWVLENAIDGVVNRIDWTPRGPINNGKPL
jgi:hypothetical protein